LFFDSFFLNLISKAVVALEHQFVSKPLWFASSGLRKDAESVCNASLHANARNANASIPYSSYGYASHAWYGSSSFSANVV
jgi:hypothetical protein